MEQVIFGKTQGAHASKYGNWKKESIFFQLPYWKDLLIRHNLDVMHIEKIVCESLVSTLLGMEKSKDNLNSRRDLEWLDIRSELWLQERHGVPNMPVACYNLSSVEKQNFCQFLKDVKVPDGFSSNISRNLLDLKSYVRNRSRPEGSICGGYLAQ